MSHPCSGSRNLRDGLCHAAGLISTLKPRNARGELGRGKGWVTAGEVIGTEILVAGAVGQHVVGDGEDRGRHGDSSFFGPAPCLERRN